MFLSFDDGLSMKNCILQWLTDTIITIIHKNVINNTIISIDEKSLGEVRLSVASRMRERRLVLNLTQAALAKKAMDNKS